MSELKECPFCGGNAEIETEEYGGSAKYVSEVYCVECGVGMSNLYGDPEGAISKWNGRV